MDAAKAAINKFTSQRGHHTTVEESVQPAVVQETIKPVRHEEVTQAVDREVHQHHYHTTVQPLTHQEKLAEKHTHNVLPTENREFRHGNEHEDKQRLAADLSHFTDSQRVEQTRVTQAAAPTVTGEHVHHHVHETVVPVVHKETIQPEVVHTTVPIHETHIAAAQHHGLSALPMKSLDEFTRSGGKLTGGSHGAHEEYDGQPRHYNDKLATTFDKLGLGHSGSHAGAGVAGAGVGAAGAGIAGRQHRRRGSNSSSSSSSSDESVGGTRRKKDKLSRRNRGTGGATGGILGHNSGHNTTGTTGTSGGVLGHNSGHNTTGSGYNNGSNLGHNQSAPLGTTNTNTNTTTSTNTSTHKPSLMDRLNPRKDADGDGKAGFGK